ncbi:MAG TPA: histidine phosphatase family protein [Aromatoleum sp.]|uniref:histidine phosphatase family protein n=1 Tax=Aromatoleum sp. TaxID=2307007 RepID=UPI002B46ED6B|nr:histidine phosphatase family protein [Aromatoleum sp.]HJV26005.1 histidine phosphatase family protein [Aromatoleum sp.]
MSDNVRRVPALPGTRCRRRIYLMRHADVSYFDAQGKPLDPRTVPLTAEGRRQAAASARLLADVRFDLALCSGLTRTIETARIVLGNRDLPLEEDARLKEVRGSRFSDIPADASEQTIAYAYESAGDPEGRFIGGERWIDFGTRVTAAWRDLIARDDWCNLLLVAHDGVNRVLMSAVVGAGLAGLGAFEQDPACINIIELDILDDRLQRAYLRAVNIAAYDHVRDGHHLMVMEKIHRNYNAR